MILAVPRNSLTPDARSAILAKGYLLIECDNPEQIRVINPEQHMDSSDWFMAALHACVTTNPVGKADLLVSELYRRLKKKEEQPTPLPGAAENQIKNKP